MANQLGFHATKALLATPDNNWRADHLAELIAAGSYRMARRFVFVMEAAAQPKAPTFEYRRY